MLLSEFLFNLLSLNSSWKAVLDRDGELFIIYVDKGRIVRVELDGNVLGEEEVKALFRESFSKNEEVESVELLPLEGNVETNLSLDQGTLFSLISQDFQGEELEEAGQGEVEGEGELINSIREFLKNYFPETAFSLFSYEENSLFKELSNCSHSIFNFKNYSVLLVKGLPVAVFITSREAPTLELYEKEVVSKLLDLASKN